MTRGIRKAAAEIRIVRRRHGKSIRDRRSICSLRLPRKGSDTKTGYSGRTAHLQSPWYPPFFILLHLLTPAPMHRYWDGVGRTRAAPQLRSEWSIRRRTEELPGPRQDEVAPPSKPAEPMGTPSFFAELIAEDQLAAQFLPSAAGRACWGQEPNVKARAWRAAGRGGGRETRGAGRLSC